MNAELAEAVARIDASEMVPATPDPDAACLLLVDPSDWKVVRDACTLGEKNLMADMCRDVWQSMYGYTEAFDKLPKGSASVPVAVMDLVNWCQVAAMAERAIRAPATPAKGESQNG